MKNTYLTILRSDLLRNTSILISGTALAQLIPILLQPVLRRYFTPDNFGAYSVYLSLLGILIVISSLRYELAIILPEEDDEAASVFFLSVILNFGFNFVIFLGILIWKSEILSFLNLSENYDLYLYLTPLGLFLISFYQSINYWLIRKKGFFAISVNKFVRRGFEGGAQMAFKFARVANGLIYGDLIGHTANVCSGIYQAAKTGLSLARSSPRKILYVLKKYSEYPKYNLAPAFMEATSYLLPVIMINKFFSSESTGYFDLSKLLLSIPLALVASSLSNVLLHAISEKDKLRKSIRKDLLFILFFVALIIILEITVIMLFGEELFTLFFGSGWELSGTISKILVWSFAYSFLTSSFSSIFIALNKIKLLSFYQVFYFLAILILFFFNHLSFESFLKVYVIIEVICSTVVSLLIIKTVINYERKILIESI